MMSTEHGTPHRQTSILDQPEIPDVYASFKEHSETTTPQVKNDTSEKSKNIMNNDSKMSSTHDDQQQQKIPEAHTSFNQGGVNAAANDEKTKDILNNISGNFNAMELSHQHTTECKNDKCDKDTANHAGETEIRRIQEGNNGGKNNSEKLTPTQTTQFNQGSHISTTASDEDQNRDKADHKNENQKSETKLSSSATTPCAPGVQINKLNQGSHINTTTTNKSEKCASDGQKNQNQKAETHFSSSVTAGVPGVHSRTIQAETIQSTFQTSDEHAQLVCELRKKADEMLKYNDAEFAEAQRLQSQARIISDIANAKTSKALDEQQRGQELLAEAGAEMIEVGAKLQREAAALQRKVPYNTHSQGAVRQTTFISAAGQEAAVLAHEIHVSREVEKNLPQIVKK